MRGAHIFLVALAATAASSAQAAVVCTVIADARDGQVLLSEGDCETRVTPASTFKIALAAMGYDSGLLADTHSPVLAFRPGYPDWGGEAWRRPTDPTAWMRHSVVWYSQRIAQGLGVERLHDYGRRFAYGNADFSGDPGKNNALERAWISSSLTISPREQTLFLRKLITGRLPISREAAAKTVAIVESGGSSDGWRISGKTGSAYPRKADGSLDRARGWGWYVGWAQKDATTVVFARLARDERREQRSGGLRARDALLAEWGSLAARASR
jgi:beta-lactamase class D